MKAKVLILPGITNSGPDHWQTLWEQSSPDFVRVQQHDWDNPICSDWVDNIETAVRHNGPDVVLVAHSLGCLALAHWASRLHSPIKAALLVAVPDPDGPSFPPEAVGFSQTPTARFSFPVTVVCSDNDPYGTLEFSEKMTTAWGGRLVQIGSQGHINADSGLGMWPQGIALLDQLRA